MTTTAAPAIEHRYDFVSCSTWSTATPNGDPDRGERTACGPETGHGLVSDVCLTAQGAKLHSSSRRGRPDGMPEPGFDI